LKIAKNNRKRTAIISHQKNFNYRKKNRIHWPDHYQIVLLHRTKPALQISQNVFDAIAIPDYNISRAGSRPTSHPPIGGGGQPFCWTPFTLNNFNVVIYIKKKHKILFWEQSFCWTPFTRYNVNVVIKKKHKILFQLLKPLQLIK